MDNLDRAPLVRAMAPLVRVTLRLPASLHAQLADAAHAARVPLGVYIREVLAGSPPPMAPPALDAAGLELGALLGRLASNLTQLAGHAVAAGEPLARLAREGGELERLAGARDRAAESLEIGELEGSVTEWLQRLDEPARALNALAARLNRGERCPQQEWAHPLRQLARALGVVS